MNIHQPSVPPAKAKGVTTMDSRKRLLARLAIFLVGLLGFGYFLAHTRNSFAQGDDDQSLDIERHGEEPLELVDLKLNDKSIKTEIRTAFRHGDDGRDQAKFKKEADWFKHLRIKMRNKSGQTIVGLQAYLYFKPLDSPILFSASLTGTKQLEHTKLDPGEEIEMVPDEGSLDRAVHRIKEHGGDPNLATVTFVIGIVGFSDGLQWHKGHLLRPDPNNPQRRIPVEPTKEGSAFEPFYRPPPSFTPAAFRSDEFSAWRLWGKGAPTTLTRPPQANAQCVLDNGSYDAPYCNNDEMAAWCHTINELGAGQGTLRVFQRLVIVDGCPVRWIQA
jgi:hypothetical protein